MPREKKKETVKVVRSKSLAYLIGSLYSWDLMNFYACTNDLIVRVNENL